MGIPSVLIPFAQNQQLIAKQVQDMQLGAVLAADDIQTHLVQTLRQLRQKEPYQNCVDRSLSIVDGQGVHRVIAMMTQ